MFQYPHETQHFMDEHPLYEGWLATCRSGVFYERVFPPRVHPSAEAEFVVPLDRTGAEQTERVDFALQGQRI
jgi:hypothetical protein